MPDRRGNYSLLLSQSPDDAVPIPTIPDSRTSRTQQPAAAASRAGAMIGLQRQSSDSSFCGSSFTSEYYAPTVSAAATSEFDPSGELYRVGGVAEVVALAGGGMERSWAQQTEESYQLQMALALRVAADASCADDPNFLDPVPDLDALRTTSMSAEAMSHRFWVNGCLSYSDKIPDGFYLINGMNPYVWNMCTDLQESGRIPSMESLKPMASTSDFSIDIVLVDLRNDLSFKDLQNAAQRISSNCLTTHEVAEHLAKLVCSQMGGAVSNGEDELLPFWRQGSDNLKDCFKSIVFPIGSLSVGLCKHRSLLFKLLADTIDLPCRIAKGCKYCARDDASSCLIRFGINREYVVDLIGKPGSLCDPDSLLNGPSSVLISSLLRFPQRVPVDRGFKSVAKQYFTDCLTLDLVFDDAETDAKDVIPILNEGQQVVSKLETPEPSLPKASSKIAMPDIARDTSKNYMVSEQAPDISNMNTRAPQDIKYLERGHVTNPKSSGELSFNMEGLEISWNDLILKEKIGAGSYGTVHRADWHGDEVAVKILTEQDFPEEVSFQKFMREFLREVLIMKSLRHPNIVLFMGAVTQRPHLSIVTEFLSRGSLFRILHRPGAREILDERRRLNMAYDVAKGMNYLHKRNPPIVHRDLKSPNLLVDKKFTVKVCDFGLSRLKTNTYISSKSAAGTPEWMAPEVLRDEPSNEKSDVYSFGVILWELATMQKPWNNLNAAQVVAAVGFRGKRLEVPCGLNPQMASLIEACWANESWKRPSFSNIMELLKPLIKAPVDQQQPG